MKKYIAEFVGTAALVIIGCGAVTAGNLGQVLGGGGVGYLAVLPIGLAFGLAVTAMAYGIGPISGCHINPAVTVGVWSAGRMPTSDVPGYIIAQVAGAIVGALVLYLILSGKATGWDFSASGGGMGQTTWDSAKGFSATSAFIAELVGTFLFLVCILGATSAKGGAGHVAGLAIGLTLAALHLINVPISGNSLNPARSLGPALFVGGPAITQLWLYILAPLVGGYAAGFLFKNKTLED